MTIEEVEDVIREYRDAESYVIDEYIDQNCTKFSALETDDDVTTDFDKWFETADLSYAKEHHEKGLASRGE